MCRLGGRGGGVALPNDLKIARKLVKKAAMLEEI